MYRDKDGTVFLTYDGDTMSINDWHKDKRCAVKHLSSLRRRVEIMGWDDEKAITYQAKETPPRYVTAWGERKRVSEWLKDKRCKIDSPGALYRRLNEGHDPETALSTPSGQLFGLIVTAFGETKSTGKWQEDDVCRVHARTIVARVKKGMSPEEAIRKPSPKPLGDRTPQEWFEREVRAQQRLKEIKGLVPLAFLESAVTSLGKHAEVAYSNRHPDGQGSFCFGIWTDLRTLPRLVHAMDRADLGLSGRMWKGALAPQKMNHGYLYLFCNWFATDDDGTVVYE
jgi:hypothetical protein